LKSFQKLTIVGKFEAPESKVGKRPLFKVRGKRPIFVYYCQRKLFPTFVTKIGLRAFPSVFPGGWFYEATKRLFVKKFFVDVLAV
jgi:hypothetical protein